MSPRRVARQNPLPIKDPAWLKQDPSGHAIRPPVQSRGTDLPFTEIGWQDFERLCRRLAGAGRHVEAAWAYGEAGQRQYGIDILVRLSDGSYEVWQTKRYERVRPSDIGAAIAIFLNHPWAERATRLVLAYACPLRTTAVVEAIESARDQLAARSISLIAHDAVTLTTELIIQPEIIDDFFGRPWVERTCPPEAQDRLRNRLSAVDRQALRMRLRGLYESWISTVDPGMPIAQLGRSGAAVPALPLRDRFVEPDFLARLRQLDDGAARAPHSSAETERSLETLAGEDATRRISHPTRAPVREQRISLENLLESNRQIVIAGGAGSGKTTLLRAIALDMLADEPRLAVLKERYQGWLPVWIPFALWSRMASGAAVPPAIANVVQAFFEARGDRALGEALARALDGGRAVLLVDGLDEAADRTAARTVSSLLFAFAENQKMPVILTSRPHGLTAFGALPASWMDVALAPMNDGQRHRLAKLWFRVLETYERDDATGAAQIEAFAETRTRAFLDAIKRSAGLGALSSTPLFLLALLGLYRQGKALPTSRLAAIAEIVAQLVEHQPQRRDVDALATTGAQGSHQRQRDRILDDFAFHLHTGAFSSSTPDAAPVEAAVQAGMALLSARQPDLGSERAESIARDVFAFAQERAGLLAHKSTHEIGFLHLSFQEYLAARHIDHGAFADRLVFVRQHATDLRWREPILYLLHLTSSEAEVRELLAAIQAAPCDDEARRRARDTLVVDAVFADLAHDIPSVSLLADQLFAELESSAAGKRERHLLSSVVDGLKSEAVGHRCRTKIAEWLPNRHGWHRAAALKAMAQWPKRRWPECIPILLRSLYADEESAQRAAAETLSVVARHDETLKGSMLERVRDAPSATALAALLYGLCCGWPHDDETGVIATEARSVSSLDVAMEAIRIRAVRGESDDADFKRYFGTLLESAPFLGTTELWLTRHFAQTQRDGFISALETAIGRPEQQRPHDLQSLANALIVCDPSHPLVEPSMLILLRERYLLRDIFGPNGFDLQNMIWTPPLIEAVEAKLRDEDGYFPDYEFYWVAKHIRSEKMKPYFIENLRRKDSFKFWSARALVEVWGKDDPAVGEALLPFMDAEPGEIALVAHLLPPVVGDDAACRRAFVKALAAGPVRRVDMLITALRNLGIDSQDNEAFAASLSSRSSLAAPLYDDQWREQMILTFPQRAEVRALAEAEILRRDGDVGAVATSFGTDDAMVSALIRVLGPLREESRLSLVAHLREAANSSADAIDLMQQAREDTAGSVSSEATIGTIEVLAAQDAIKPADIERLTGELDAVGPDYEAHRITAAISLAVTGRFDIAAQATHRDKLLGYPMSRASLQSDDRYLRRILQLWPALVASLGSPENVVQCFSLTAEAVLGLLDPIQMNARALYDTIMADIDEARHVSATRLLGTAARFEPGSERVRQLVLKNLIPQRTFDADAAIAAAEIVADQFADDTLLHAALLDHLVRDPSGPVAGALAELASGGNWPAMLDGLRDKALNHPHDLLTHYRLMAVLAPPSALMSDLKMNLAKLDLDALRYRPIIWPRALVHRVRNDPELQTLIREAADSADAATETLTFAGLYRTAIGPDAQLQAIALRLLSREAGRIVPTVGMDVSTGVQTLLNRYLIDLLN